MRAILRYQNAHQQFADLRVSVELRIRMFETMTAPTDTMMFLSSSYSQCLIERDTIPLQSKEVECQDGARNQGAAGLQPDRI